MTKKIKIRHIATEFCSDVPQAIKSAYDGCLNQLIGHFLSNDVIVENSLAVHINSDNGGRGVMVIMMGYCLYTEVELAAIRKADVEYRRQQEAKHG